MALRMLGMGQPPDACFVAHDPLELVISAQGVAAILDKAEYALPIFRCDPAVCERRAHFAKQRILLERPRTGTCHHMLRQHVEPAGPEILTIALTRINRIFRCGCFEEFEAVARHQDRTAGHVQAVIGAADPLQQSRGTLGRAHLNYAVDIPPVDTQIETGSAHQRAQLAARHRAFDLAPRFDRKTAMMDADRQIVFVHIP